jgi:D-alanine-D-alanine ligase
MHIGLTYDLRSEYLAAGYSEEETAEFDRNDTVDSLESALGQLGHDTVRIGNARHLVERLAAGDRWDLVFNICEGLRGMARESQVPAILDVFEIPYTFADPVVMSICLHKGLAKTVVREAGLPTPRFAVVVHLSDLERVDLEYPMFAKPVAEGTGKGIDFTSRIEDSSSLVSVCDGLLARFHQPVLVEEFLPGRELTVGLLGTGADAEVLGTLEIILRPNAEPGVYSYVNKERCEELVQYVLVDAKHDEEVRRAEEIALAAWRVLGCRDAGRIDLRGDATGRPEFLEANPLAGLHPQHSDLPMLCITLNMSYSELIERIVFSAQERVTSCTASRPRVL